MSKKKLIWIIIAWIILTLLNYYYVPYFILAFEWILLIGFFFVLTIIQIVKLFKERKQLTRQRIYSLVIVVGLFLMTLYRDIPNRIIEKVDWLTFLNKRIEIVEQVKNNELKPNVDWNGWVCELPFEFPIVSNGGNDIGIFKNKTDSSLTIEFWVFRNFFDSPSTYFIYTDDKQKLERLEKKINQLPKQNWKIRENWYRIFGEY
jgi:hypothetical protein